MFLALSHSHSFCVFFCLISGPNGNLDLLDVPAFTNDCRDSSGVDVGSSASPRDLWPLCSSVEMFHQGSRRWRLTKQRHRLRITANNFVKQCKRGVVLIHRALH